VSGNADTAPASRRRRVSVYVWLSLFALIVAALSLRLPSTPSYDPWSWLIWGREVIHGDLELGGITSWKPLPVIFTTVFALFRGAQPDLWLLVVRAAMIVSLCAIFRLAFRTVWNLQRVSEDDDDPRSGDEDTARPGLARWALGIEPAGERYWQWLPALLAGLLAAIALLLTGVYFSNTMIGYSEALAVAAVLVGIDCAYDGHHLPAYALGLAAALDRPEAFVFLAPYGLWLLWRKPRLRVWVIALGLLALALWFIPQKIVTGSFTGSVSAAQFVNPGSAATFPCPFCHEMHYFAWPMAPVQLEILAGITGVAALIVLVLSLLPWSAPAWSPQPLALSRRQQALIVTCLAAAYGILWMVLIAFDVAHGFAGNERYMVLGSTLLILAGSIGFGWAALELSAIGGARGRARARQLVIAAVVCTSVVLFVPKWIGKRMVNLGNTHRELAYQSRLRNDLSALVGQLGPAARLVGCGPVVAEHFQIPMVAWYLHVPTTSIQDTPGEWKEWGSARPVLPRGYPNVIIQASAAINPPDARNGYRWTRTPMSPDPGDIRRWRQAGGRYRVVRDGLVTVYTDCGTATDGPAR
jgi:hypothetical protein